MAGLTSTGFETKTYQDIVAEFEAAWRLAFGANVNVDPDTPNGQLIALLADRESALWEALEALHSSRDPDEAEGESQDIIGALRGTTRRTLTSSTATVTLMGDASTSVPSGTQISTSDLGDVFATDATVTLDAVSAWSSATAYALGTRVYNDGKKVYQCVGGGTSAGSGGPTGTGASITDNTVSWRYLGEVDSGSTPAAKDVQATATTTGAVPALADTLTEIDTPVVGLDAVTNILDAAEGFDYEEDPAYRIRQEQGLAGQDSPSVPGVLEEIRAQSGVTHANLLVNNTDATVDTIPPNHLEAVVLGGEDGDIAGALFRRVAGGVGTSGSTTYNYEFEGTGYPQKFTRPTPVQIHVELEIDSLPGYDTSDLAALVRAKVLEDLDAYVPGQDVTISAIIKSVMAIDGIKSVDLSGDTGVDTSDPPGGNYSVTINARSLATLDTADLDISVSEDSEI